MNDAAERATTNATDAGDAEIATLPVETRQRGPGEPAAIYSLCDRRLSGEVRTLAEYSDLIDAQAALALLRAQGSDCWLELIPTPIIR